MILSQARRVTTSDAGSIYLVERGPDDAPRALRFKLSQNDSLGGVPYKEFSVPIDHTSLAGHAAATREPMIIDDVYLLPEGASYKQNRSFDERTGYHTKSMLVFPLTTLRDDIVGVLQLINRKRNADAQLSSAATVESEVVAYDARAVELVGALASQAAVSIENSLLYEDIEKLFEGFVTAAVTAIESRDPSTSGHSGRVAVLSVGLADSLAREGVGRFRNFRFSPEQIRELRYASLLHDFGKVGVREQVLIKAKKLYPPTLVAIRDRVGFLKQGAELEFERARVAFLSEHGKRGYSEHEATLRARLAEQHAELDRFAAAVVSCNEPSLLKAENATDLREFGARTFLGWDGAQHPLLDEDELRLLTIPQGTLDEAERKEIESHVTHTFRFLREIPWTRELRNLPNIAFGHHEKLTGVGYPRGLKGDEIPVQTRIMTISDIFDALTASDRPYKRAVELNRALDILNSETRGGLLDADLVRVFLDAKVYDRLPSDA
jgi:HD-GYP domain-containing protein (c-di-GMP phosphodiesterase class II)